MGLIFPGIEYFIMMEKAFFELKKGYSPVKSPIIFQQRGIYFKFFLDKSENTVNM